MATVQKTVTFFDTRVVTDKGDGEPAKVKRVRPDFWAKVLKRLEKISDHKNRIYTVNRRQYYGIVSRPTSPALDHIQVGRLRDLSEHLEQTNLSDGAVSPLVLGPNLRVSEPTFLIPFGNVGRVAIMSPGRSTRPETIAHWLTGVLGLPAKGKSIIFRPIVDKDVLEALLNSHGAVGVEFHLDADSPLPEGDSLLDAVESVRANGPEHGTIYVGWSLGREGGSVKDKNIIKRVATEIATKNLARRAKVNMVVENEQGQLRREQHDLFEDQIVTKVSYRVSPDVRSDESTILDAIAKAIDDFNQRGV